MKFIDIEKRPNYIKVRISSWVSGNDANHELDIAESWCREVECGKRINRWSFAFKTDAEFTMFALRWQTE